MCGIAVIFAYNKRAKNVSLHELERINNCMVPRGPDGKGLWLSKDERLGMAHRRLAIIDPTDSGRQPMETADGQLRIVYNGEIYNYRAVRDLLSAKGYRFRTQSDTEVILHAYREYGAEVVHILRGMFAFAIWDKKRQGLFLARDPFGIKPLYYHNDGRVIRVVSQVKALIGGAGFDVAPEPAGHVGFFLWGNVPEPFTLYRNLVALQAGHTMWVDGNGPRPPVPFFSVSDEFRRAGSEDITVKPIAEILHEAVRDSVRHHLVSDVPVGLFLSAGVDSGILAALASEISPNIEAHTLAFEEFRNSDRDETPLAANVAEIYNCTHHAQWISKEDFIDELPNLLGSMDQPSIDGVNTYLVARGAARSGLKVALSGLGGDELFGSYPTFWQVPKSVSRIGIPGKVPGLGRLFRVLSAPIIRRFTSPKYAGLFEYGGRYSGAYVLRRSLFMPWELTKFLDKDMLREGWATLQPFIRLDEILTDLPTNRARVSALELTVYMRNMLLRDSDWAGMAHSLEIRVPLVDISLFRSLAPYIARPNFAPVKEDLRNVPNVALPAEVFERPKTGFGTPMQDWLGSTEKTSSNRGFRRWAMHTYLDSTQGNNILS